MENILKGSKTKIIVGLSLIIICGILINFNLAQAACPDGTAIIEPDGVVCVPTSDRTGLSGIKIAENAAGKDSLLLNVAQWLTGILAAVTILVIIIAGIMYITSAGDEDRANAAKKALTYAIIGLAIALLSWVIVKVISTTLGAN